MMRSYLALLGALLTMRAYDEHGSSAAVLVALGCLGVFGIGAAARHVVRYVTAKAAPKGGRA